MLTDFRHDARAHKRAVVLAAGTLAVATLSSIAPVPQIATLSAASASTTSVTAVQSDAATLDLAAAGAVVGTATTKAVAAVSAPAPKKRTAPKPVRVRAAAVVAPFAFGTTGYAQWHAKRLMASSRYGWKSTTQFTCLVSLWTRESHWNYRSHNRSSGAHGIPQALPGSKMRIAGTDWLTNPVTQIRWGLGYIKGRYGSPCGAWSHFRSHSWY